LFYRNGLNRLSGKFPWRQFIIEQSNASTFFQGFFTGGKIERRDYELGKAQIQFVPIRGIRARFFHR
jgi:hypothetical protein